MTFDLGLSWLLVCLLLSSYQNARVNWDMTLPSVTQHPNHIQRAVKRTAEQPPVQKQVLSICSCHGRYSLTGLSSLKFTPDSKGLERQHLSWEGTKKIITFWKVNLRHVSILASRRDILLRTNSWNRNIELAWLWRTQHVRWELPTASLSQKNGAMVIKNVLLSFWDGRRGARSTGGRISRIWLEGGEGCLWNIGGMGSNQEAPDYW